uniref:Uncharacterized protein n=1 Tax=Aegilops tauschii subsp. strangulata TaxID=200361 RepID=A0A453NZC4_AEGTS
MLLQGCSRTRGHGYYSSTWSCSCGLFISNNAIKPSEVPRRFPFAAPLFGCSRAMKDQYTPNLSWPPLTRTSTSLYENSFSLSM